LRKNCLLKQVIEEKINGRIEVAGIRARRRKKPLDDNKEDEKLLETEKRKH